MRAACGATSRSRAPAKQAWEAGNFDLVQSHERIPGCDLYRAGDGVHAEWLDIRRAEAASFERLGIALNLYHRYVCAAERRMFAHPRLRAVICNSAWCARKSSAASASPPACCT